MFKSNNFVTGFEIETIADCDFSLIPSYSNEDILQRTYGKAPAKMARLLENQIGVSSRHQVSKDQNALDLGESALERLLEKAPEILEEAEFLIWAGISNPLPTVCTSAYIAGKYGFKNVSCWDVKSGCSSALLSVIQVIPWFEKGTKKGVIVSAESLSKFSSPEVVQVNALIGDGASAAVITQSNDWKIRGVLHGSDPKYLASFYVPGKYPVDVENYNQEEYYFQFSAEKSDAMDKSDEYWHSSLGDILELSDVRGSEVTHYIAHQANGHKIRETALSYGIPEEALLENFKNYGNIGAPSLFLNQLNQMVEKGKEFQKGDIVVYHAVGGGLSWASICLEKLS